VARLLSLKPLVYVGLISYSRYLWHWVFLVFLKYYLVRPLSGWEVGGFVGGSLLAASLSWRLVEHPFRGQQGLIKPRPRLFAAAAAGSMTFAAFGLLLHASHGLPARFNSQVRSLIAEQDLWQRDQKCNGQICQIGDPAAAPSFLLWGDSHAGVIAPLFESLAKANGVSGWVASMNGCAPLPGVHRYERNDAEQCSRFNASVLSHLESHPVQQVFLHARWALYSEGSHYQQETGDPAFLTPDRKPDKDYSVFEALLLSTVHSLRRMPVRITIISSVPEMGVDVPRIVLREAALRSPFAVGTPFSDFTKRQERVFDLFARLARDGVRVAYPHEVLCAGTWCSGVKGDKPLYLDTQHLNVHGAMLLGPVVGPLLHAPE
jgi:hypothetical protein